MISSPSSTIIDHVAANAAERGEQPALRWWEDGEWRALTWGAYRDRVWDLAAGLLSVGVEAGDRVAVLASNRPEWHIADLATLAVGGVTVPVYSTSTSSQVSYILSDAGAVVCVVDTPAQLAKVLLRLDELPALRHAVVVEEPDGMDADFVLDFAELESRGRAQGTGGVDLVDARAAAVQPDDVATLVYTSGTTGPPKGTMLTHRNVIETISSLRRVAPFGPEDRLLSFLPLSHIAERLVSDFGQVVSGCETWFARSLATVPEDLTACRPTIFFAVPRVWEKFQVAIIDKIEAQPAMIGRLFDEYVAGGMARVAHEQDHLDWGLRERARHALLDHTIGALVRHQAGLDRARVLVSGAAPIHPDLVRWFHAIGVPIAEVYGQTEGCGPTTLNPPNDIRIGTVGPPIPGVEVRIAADGEVLVRGPNVCPGYFHAPEATAELIDADGWMHSGDLGVLDPDGYLRITGRKKDLIVNAAGKNIAPTPIETDLCAHPLIAHAVVIGDQRPYLVALITLDLDELVDWAAGHGRILDPEALSTDADVLSAVESAVDAVNRGRAPVERIKRWAILPEDFTVANDELTPTLKVRRPRVLDHHRDVVEQLYASAASPKVGSAQTAGAIRP